MSTKRIAAWAGMVLLLAGACSRRGRVSPEEADQLRPESEWTKEESIRLLRDYVRIDTQSNGPGERAGALFLQRIFDCAGISSEIVCPAPGRCNLLARIPGKRRNGGLLLLNHIDVAPVFPQYWKDATPFGGTFRLGYLYGRGSYDMKSIGLAEALAMRDVAAAGIVPETDLLFLGEADEEAGQKWGSRWLLEHRPEWFEGVGAVLNEGGNAEMILRDVRFMGLETVQAGTGFFEFHSKSPDKLTALATAVPRLDAPTVEPDPQIVESFNRLANHLSNPLTDPLRHLDRVRRDPKELAILPDRYGAFLEPRIHWPGVYSYPPGQTTDYRTYVVISTPPGVDPAPFLERVEKAARDAGVDIVDRSSSGATTASPWPTPFTEMLGRDTQVEYPGIPFGPSPGFGGSTTSIYFRQRGIPAYGFVTMPFNVTDTARRHGNDERIYLRDYVRGINLMKQVVLDYAFFAPETKTSPDGGHN